MSAVLSPLDAVVARAEIEALNVEFAHLIDHGMSERVPELFTEDGWYGRETGERSTGREAIGRAFAARGAGGARTARHIFTNLRLAFTSPDEAEGVTILLLFAGDGPPPLPAEPALVQDYVDRYRRIDGRWLFASRETRRVFVAANFRQALPLGR